MKNLIDIYIHTFNLAQKTKTEVAVSDLSSLLEEEAGAGLENFTTDDMQIPFIRILQALSPQLNKQDSMYMKGAEQGDIFNTVSQQVFRAEEGIIVVPCFFEKKFLEFALRSSGGGFITSDAPEANNSYQVDVVTLDSFFNNKFSNETTSIFIKIDLEGYDIKAISGAKEILLNYDCSVIFEFSKLTMKQKDYSIEDIQFFINKGFKLYDIYGMELNCKDLETKIFQLDKDHETCGNFILSKKKLNFSF